MGRGKDQAPDLGKILCERGVWTLSAADFGEKLGTTWPSGFPGPIYAARLSDLFQQSQVPIPALSGMGRCSLKVSPPLRASSPHRAPGANCPDSLGFICLHFRGKAAYICVLRAKSLFLLISACPLEMFVSQALNFYCGAVGGKLGKNEKSFTRVARACLPFLKSIILLLRQPSARGPWEILGFGWNHGAGRAGCLLGTWMLAASDLPKEPSQGILTAHRAPQGSLAVGCLGRFHSSWASKETLGLRAIVVGGFPSVGSGTRLEIWVPSEVWRVPAFPWR